MNPFTANSTAIRKPCTLLAAMALLALGACSGSGRMTEITDAPAKVDAPLPSLSDGSKVQLIDQSIIDPEKRITKDDFLALKARMFGISPYYSVLRADLFCVRQGDKFGILRLNAKTGEQEEALPSIYDGCVLATDKRAVVEKDGLFGVVNRDDKVIVPFEYVTILPFDENNFLLRGEDGMWRAANWKLKKNQDDEDGKLVLSKTTLEDAMIADSNHLVVRRGGKWGVVSLEDVMNGAEIPDTVFEFDDARTRFRYKYFDNRDFVFNSRYGDMRSKAPRSGDVVVKKGEFFGLIIPGKNYRSEDTYDSIEYMPASDMYKAYIPSGVKVLGSSFPESFDSINLFEDVKAVGRNQLFVTRGGNLGIVLDGELHMGPYAVGVDKIRYVKDGVYVVSISEDANDMVFVNENFNQLDGVVYDLVNLDGNFVIRHVKNGSSLEVTDRDLQIKLTLPGYELVDAKGSFAVFRDGDGLLTIRDLENGHELMPGTFYREYQGAIQSGGVWYPMLCGADNCFVFRSDDKGTTRLFEQAPGTIRSKGCIGATTCEDKDPLFTQNMIFRNPEGKWGIFDFNGNVVVGYRYDAIIPMNDYLLLAVKDGRKEVIDLKGTVVAQAGYDHYRANPYNNILIVQKGDKCGFVNSKGKVIGEPEYEKCGFFKTVNNARLLNRAIVMKNGKYGLVDINNDTKIPFIYDNIEWSVRLPFDVSGRDRNVLRIGNPRNEKITAVFEEPIDKNYDPVMFDSVNSLEDKLAAEIGAMSYKSINAASEVKGRLEVLKKLDKAVEKKRADEQKKMEEEMRKNTKEEAAAKPKPAKKAKKDKEDKEEPAQKRKDGPIP